MTTNITIVADQEAFFADAATHTHPPNRWIQAKCESYSTASPLRSIPSGATDFAPFVAGWIVLASFSLSRAFAADAEELAQARNKARIAHSSNIRAAGEEVEDAVRSYLARMLPPSYRVTKGHVIDWTGTVSPQLDVVITDSRGFASLMTTRDGTEYIPFTSVYAIGEIKSTYYKSKAPLQNMHEVLQKLSAMERPLVENTVYGGFSGDTLIEDMVRASPHRYLNNLFTFVFCVDKGDFDFGDVKQFFTSSDVRHLPNMTVLLDLGMLFYSRNDIEESANHIRYPNEAASSNCDWCFVRGNPEAPGTAAGTHLSTLWGALISHLSNSYLEAPNVRRYLEAVSVFSRSSRQWAGG